MKSDTFIRHFTTDSDPIEAPHGITFIIAGRLVHVKIEGGLLQINSGSERMSIEPVMANVINVRVHS